ncbi:MAG: hypothetical protein R2720_00980 [Candidatus Nanopelagicales bacterium]
MKRIEVTFTRKDGSEVSEYVWGLAPKVRGYWAETYWILLGRRFVLIGRPKSGDRSGPFQEILEVQPNQQLEVTASGWLDPGSVPAA